MNVSSLPGVPVEKRSGCNIVSFLSNLSFSINLFKSKKRAWKSQSEGGGEGLCVFGLLVASK